MVTMSRKEVHIRTIYDLAKVAGVSPATVSFALNNKGNINEKTRKRIQALARQYHYSPNKIAGRLRKSKTSSLGVVIDHFHNRFFNSVFDGIESVAGPLGYSFLVAESREDYKKEKREIALLLEHGVDGLILFPCSQEHSFMLDMSVQYEVPVVLIGNFHNAHAFPERVLVSAH